MKNRRNFLIAATGFQTLVLLYLAIPPAVTLAHGRFSLCDRKGECRLSTCLAYSSAIRRAKNVALGLVSGASSVRTICAAPKGRHFYESPFFRK